MVEGAGDVRRGGVTNELEEGPEEGFRRADLATLCIHRRRRAVERTEEFVSAVYEVDFHEATLTLSEERARFDRHASLAVGFRARRALRLPPCGRPRPTHGQAAWR